MLESWEARFQFYRILDFTRRLLSLVPDSWVLPRLIFLGSGHLGFSNTEIGFLSFLGEVGFDRQI